MSLRARIPAAATLCAALALAAGCGAQSAPSGLPAPTTTATPTPACSALFRVGAPVTGGLATEPCVNNLGVTSTRHFMACHDGRELIFDRDANVYGFPGGRFAVSDTAAGSQYAHDYAACIG